MGRLTGVGGAANVLAGGGRSRITLIGGQPLSHTCAGVEPLPAPPRRGCQYQPAACEWFHARRGDPYRALM